MTLVLGSLVRLFSFLLNRFLHYVYLYKNVPVCIGDCYLIEFYFYIKQKKNLIKLNINILLKYEFM